MIQNLNEVLNNLLLLGIRKDAKDIHELHDGIVVTVPLVLAGEVLMDLAVYLVANDAEACGIVGLGVHEL